MTISNALQYTEAESLTQLSQGCELGKKAQLTVIADATLALLLATNDKQAKELYSKAVTTIIETGTYAKTNAYELATVAKRLIHYKGGDVLSIVNGEATLKAARNSLIDYTSQFTDNGTIARADKAAPQGRWLLPNLPLMPKDEAKHAVKSEAIKAEQAAQASIIPTNSEVSEKEEKTVLHRFNEAMAALERMASAEADESYQQAAEYLADTIYTLIDSEEANVPQSMRPLRDMFKRGERSLMDKGKLEVITKAA